MTWTVLVLCLLVVTGSVAPGGNLKRSPVVKPPVRRISPRPATGKLDPTARIIPPPPGFTTITEVLRSDEVDIIASMDIDMGKWTPVDVAGQCHWLNNKVWNVECTKSDFYSKLKPITAYVALARGYYVDYNTVHQDVPGTVFKDKTYFCPQYYVRPHRVIEGHTRVVNVDKLATILQAYPTAFGHFPHEILPKLVYMLETVPDDVKFLLDVSPFTRQYLQLLGLNESRVIPYKKNAHVVHFAKEVYFSNTAPFIHSIDPHKGGKTFLFPREVFEMVRKRIIPALPPAPPDMPDEIVVMIKRNKHARNLTNFEKLYAAIADKVGLEKMRVFEGTETVAEALRLFHSATLVVGVHGAGFANVAFCQEGTQIIEIGYDSKAGMDLDNMYVILL